LVGPRDIRSLHSPFFWSPVGANSNSFLLKCNRVGLDLNFLPICPVPYFFAVAFHCRRYSYPKRQAGPSTTSIFPFLWLLVLRTGRPPQGFNFRNFELGCSFFLVSPCQLPHHGFCSPPLCLTDPFPLLACRHHRAPVTPQEFPSVCFFFPPRCGPL